jgi:hypothetical protein
MNNRQFSNQELLEHVLFYSKKDQEILRLEKLLEALDLDDSILKNNALVLQKNQEDLHAWPVPGDSHP